MKKKLTLSVEEEVIRAAKADSKRTGKSISELFTEQFRRSRRKRVGPSWSERWGGSLGELTEADLKRDDKAGYLARRIRSAKAGSHRSQRA